MNFLEQIAAEWYEYNGHFVRANIHFGKLNSGGWKGEIDVIAFDPKTKTLIHIETSTDAISWKERKTNFLRKFRDADTQYHDLFRLDYDHLQRIAIVGFGKSKKFIDFGDNIQVKTIPEFFKEIRADISTHNPLKNAIPERYPLLRAIQFATFWK